MATKLTKFTLAPSGELVYKSTGKLAPDGYTFRKNTVYGKNGRRVGTLSRSLTKSQAKRIAHAEQSRQRRTGRAARKAGEMAKPSQDKPKKPSQKAKAGSQKYGENWDEFDDSEFPQPEEAVIEEFAQRVRDCALSVAPPALQKKIQALSSAAIWKAYQEDQYIFEIYFQYHQPEDQPHKSDISVWLYQLIQRIEQYMV